jgi:hypothetical protein
VPGCAAAEREAAHAPHLGVMIKCEMGQAYKVACEAADAMEQMS